MSDTLAIAVSQSGTTTDTNRTVDLLRRAAAAVIAIVNRRGSDLVDKADGVLFTSDGRDIEMSVASTKAFYAQVAAGALAGAARSPRRPASDQTAVAELLASLRELPEAMERVHAKREEIADAARRLAPPKRYWAVVGNGPNRVAAEEVRIKLSELCYKSIAADATEDKKHIDLSSEPLILVCAAGLRGEHRRRRGEGDRDLPRPQGDAGRDRRRGRPALQRGGDDHRAAGPPGARLRAVGDGRAPVRLRGGARHRRLGAAVARGARRSSGPSPTPVTATPCSPCAVADPALRPPLPRRAARSHLRRPPRGVDRCASWSGCCAT